MWDDAPTNVKELISVEMNHKNIHGIFISDLEGKIYSAKVKNEKGEALFVTENEVNSKGFIFKQKELEKEGVKLGSLSIYITTEFLKKKLKNSFIRKFLTVAILDTVLFFVYKSSRDLSILPGLWKKMQE